ncbi:hypothetical protein KCP69_03810 [Salmonella enterica subsp. enterica]|nr:hypothetical protein KCP69_03810 [Salmonella enterica subsp. enterica]
MLFALRSRFGRRCARAILLRVGGSGWRVVQQALLGLAGCGRRLSRQARFLTFITRLLELRRVGRAGSYSNVCCWHSPLPARTFWHWRRLLKRSVFSSAMVCWRRLVPGSRSRPAQALRDGFLRSYWINLRMCG